MDWATSGDAALVSGTDVSGCVRVALGKDARLAAIELTATWRQRMEPSQLAVAIGEAIGAAHADMSERAEEDTVIHQPDQTGDLVEVLQAVGPETRGEALRQLEEMADAALDEIDVADAPDMERAALSGSDVRGNVKVELSRSGQFGALSINSAWLESVSRERLLSTIREAFESAYAEVDSHIAGDGSGFAGVDRYRAVTASVRAFREWLDTLEGR